MSEEGSSSGSEGWETDDSCERDAAGAASSAAGSSRRDSGLSGANRGAMSGPARGTLRLDKTQASAGEVVGVYWDIPTVQTSAGDWIAIYERGGTHKHTHHTLTHTTHSHHTHHTQVRKTLSSTLTTVSVESRQTDMVT